MAEEHSILYVDDEEDNLIVFEAAFEDYYNIYTAKSAKEGIEILKNESIHLIITDQRMPEMTGIQFLEAIIPDHPHVVRMILTGFTDVDAIIQAINTGRVYHYITKPWDEKQFKIIIDHALEAYELRISNLSLLEELKQKAAKEEEVRRIFQRYVPKTIVDQILSQKDGNLFAGEVRDVVILFSDIRGFTSICSKHGPKEIVDFLNKYFSAMTSIVRKHNGTVLEFIGDGILAAFGAPLSSNNNMVNAVETALEMVETLPRINKKYSMEMLGEELKVGIGINMGEVISGNIGSDEKMKYAIIGDAVNVASRIQDETKPHPNSIIINENVYEKTKNIIEAEALKPVILRGKEEENQLYKITGRKN